MSRFANLEAVQSFTNGLALTANLPKSDESIGRSCCSSRSRSCFAGDAWLRLDEVERNYEAANTLAESLGDREAAFVSARGLWNCFYDRGDQDRSLVLAERLRDLAGKTRVSRSKRLP